MSINVDSARSTLTMNPAEIKAMLAEFGGQQQQQNHREEFPNDPSSTSSRECNGSLYNNHIGNDLKGRGTQMMKRPLQLELMHAQNISIQPRNEGIQYCKTTQTDDERVSVGEFSMGSQELAFDDEMSLDEATLQVGSFDESPTREIRKHLKNLEFHHFGAGGHQSHKETSDQEHAPASAKMPPLSDEEKRKILSSGDFSRFFTQASRVIERALAEEADIFIDYINGSRNTAEEKFDKSELLTLNRKIFDEKLTANRGVRAIDFSAFHPELVAVSYDQNKDAPLLAESVVNVWNTRFKTSSPEMTFYSSSRVMSMVLDPFQSNIIIGGCYSGQICIWDTRANKKMPVCKTSLSSNAHTQPVLCMKMVGSMNAHDLITISTDGRICSWSVDNLQQPIEAINLACSKSKKQLSALCLSFLNNSINDLVVGGEEGELYIGDRLGNKSDVTKNVAANLSPIAAHLMPITTVDTHRAQGSIDFTGLCLSASLDFCIKLWNLKDQKKREEPLLNLERKHKFYITDIQWSPVHPAVFVSLSSDGTLNLWNLNVNTENPVTSISVGDSATRLRWNRNGQQLVVGDEAGCLHLYDVHESLYNVRSSEWDDLTSTLTSASELATADGLIGPI